MAGEIFLPLTITALNSDKDGNSTALHIHLKEHMTVTELYEELRRAFWELNTMVYSDGVVITAESA